VPYKDPEKRKEVEKKSKAKYYIKNKAEIIAKQKTNRIVFNKWWSEYKKTLKCVQCGFDHPAALDFHHPPGTKEYPMNVLVRRRNKTLLQAEIAKCVVLCSNCHRIHHHNLLQAQRRKKKAKKKGAEAP